MTGFLRPRYVPQLEGNCLRLHVQRKVFGGRLGKATGRSWLRLCPGSVPGDHDEEATFDLPLEQHAALAETCAAFHGSMDEHEQRQTVRAANVSTLARVASRWENSSLMDAASVGSAESPVSNRSKRSDSGSIVGAAPSHAKPRRPPTNASRSRPSPTASAVSCLDL